MTERDDDRIDFTALGPNDSVRADSVVRAAMMRIRAGAPEQAPLLEDLGQWWSSGLLAAAAVALLALGLLLTRQRPSQEASLPVEARVLDWAESGHIPTNGELLATFQEYSR